MSEVIKAYKGFDKDFKCKGMQYEVGKTYEEPEAKCCEKGLHSCLNTLDVLSYYDVCSSEFAEVEASGKIDKATDDTKIASTKLKVVAKLSLKSLIDASIKFIFESCKADKTDYSQNASSGDYSKNASSGHNSRNASSGDNSQNASSGDYSKNASSGHNSKNVSSGDNSKNVSSGYNSKNVSSGYYSQNASSGDNSKNASSGDNSRNASSGDYSKNAMTGKNSVSVDAGINGQAKGIIGCWFCLSEWKQNKENIYVPVCVKAVKVDGKKIKADTWYTLENGKFIEVKKAL
jgi:hypothetical protein